jgi:mRNA interferase YafQ
MSLIDSLILHLEKTGTVPDKHRPHTLVGNFEGLWECHIQPDWLLVWKREEDIKLISLTRTGTHSDLF